MEEFTQQLDRRLEKIEDHFADIRASVAEIRSIYQSQQMRINEVEKHIERCNKTLFGNGNTGLCTKVSAILYLSSAIAGFVCLLLAQAVSVWVK